MHDDLLQFLYGIEFQMMDHSEAIPQRCRQKSRPGRRSYQRELWQFQTDRPGTGALTDHNVNTIIFHGGIQDFLHLAIQTVYLIHEQQISFFQIV